MNKSYWIRWAKAAGLRALRTFAQSCIAAIGSGALVLGDVNFIAVLSAGALGAVVSVLMSVAGLPEVDEEQDGE